MMPERLRAIAIRQDASLREAMDAINGAVLRSAPTGMALVVSDDDVLQGLVTDGDIRRGLLKGVGLDDSVDAIMVRDPVTLPAGLAPVEMLRRVKQEAQSRSRLRENKVEKLILVDSENRVADIVSFYELWYLSQATIRTVQVIGLGFVGLTLAVALADAGFDVVGVESNERVLESLRAGRAHFHETGLEPLLAREVRRGRLTFSSSVGDADTHIICVGTPVDDNGVPLLDDVRTATEAVAQVLGRRSLVILRSTVPVGTCRNTVIPILESASGLRAGQEFFVAFAPERTVEGKALEELRTLPQLSLIHI